MTNSQIAMRIGFFEMKSEVDICENCPRCDLKIETREYHYLERPMKTEVRGVCKNADACRGVFEYCHNEERGDKGK